MSRKSTRDRSGISKIPRPKMNSIMVKCQDCGMVFEASGTMAIPEAFNQGLAHCQICGGILKIKGE